MELISTVDMQWRQLQDLVVDFLQIDPVPTCLLMMTVRAMEEGKFHY